MKKEYCLMCNEDVNVIIHDVKKKYQDEYISIEYEGKIARCSKCGEELYNDYVTKYNQNKIQEKYKIEYEIITKEEIEQILKQYNIGKRPLSLLLNFGEITITRYLDGYIPTPKNSKILKEILYSPSDFYSILQLNKNNIKESAFNKSEAATKKLLNISSEDNTILSVSKYIVSKTEVTNLALQKLLYYIQIFYKSFFDKWAFISKCSAWDHGPVFGAIYYEYKSYGRSIIEEDESEKITLDDDLKLIVDNVIKYFGCYNGSILRAFTHSEKPWNEAYQTEEKIIEKQVLKEFGEEILNKYYINNVSEINKYSESMINNIIN